MKKTVLILSLGIGFAVAGCQTKADKDAQAAQKSEDSLTRTESNDQYLAFKKDADREIAANDDRIAHLRARLAKTQGTAPLDDARKQKVDDLEKRNAELRASLSDYKYQSADWDTFRSKWDHDRDNLRQAFHDFGDDLKN